jgi:dTDP-glucose 4,6-dehydratase
LFLLESGVSGEKYNVAGLEETDNEELVKLIADIMGKTANYELIDFHSSRPGHDLRYALSSEKMKSIGWTPAKSLRERLSEVVEWSLENNRWLL